MFESLLDERRSLRATKFHVFGLGRVERCDCPPSSSPLECLLHCFGSLKLYRRGLGHHIVVHPPGARATMDAPFASIGFVDDTELRVRSHGGRFDLTEVHLFDHCEFTTRVCEQPFDLWLRDRCREIRSTYDDQSWRDMAEAPRPFTASEQAILEARRRFSVRVAPRQEGQGERDVALIVRNESRMTLPQISVLKLGSNYQSIARIDTSQCLPGREHCIPLRAHLGQPECEYELLPDPLPEERDLYWELSSTHAEL